jgi:hypothetical protein
MINRLGVLSLTLAILAANSESGTAANSSVQLVSCQLADSQPIPKVGAKALLPITGPIKTGDPIEIQWAFTPVSNLDCHAPLYLMFSTSSRVRFEGDRIFALPPGPTAPFGIKYETDHTRVLVPLYLGSQFYSGKFRVKVYEAGSFTIKWSLVEVPVRTKTPKSMSDLAIGQIHKLDGVNLTDGVQIVGGNPSVVIRDQFTSDRPNKIIESNSGEFELQAFDHFYRVLNRKTSELVLERSGWDPNFSPSSRFLGAFADGPGFEIIDLYSGTVIVTEAILNKGPVIAGRVHLAAWSHGDAVLALSVWGQGGISIQQALVDNSGRCLNVSCHACQGYMSGLIFDPNSGVVMAQGHWASLMDASVGTPSLEDLASRQIPNHGDESDAYARQQDLIRTLSEAQLTELMAQAFRSYADAATALNNEQLGWELGDQIHLSHHCAWQNSKAGGNCLTSTVDKNDSKKELAQLEALRINHTISTATADKGGVKIASPAELRAILSHFQSRRGLDTPEKSKSLWESLQRYLGLDVIDTHTITLTKLEQKDFFSRISTEVAQQILKSIPAAANRFQDTDSTGLPRLTPVGLKMRGNGEAAGDQSFTSARRRTNGRSNSTPASMRRRRSNMAWTRAVGRWMSGFG